MNKITKIIELLIDWENDPIEDLGLDMIFDPIEDLGLDMISLVDTPAIGVDWLAFSSQFTEEDVLDIINDKDFGETFDQEETVYLDFTQEKFNTITDFIKGIVGLDIVGKKDATTDPEIKYMYDGPRGTSRSFCKAMLNLNKVYTSDELAIMGATVGNGIDQGADAVSKWHGGPNCRHWFNKVSVTRENGRAVITNLGPDRSFGTPMADRPLGGFKNARTKAKADQWYAIQKSYNSGFAEMQFAANDDQMVITGPAMKAMQMIPRKDDNGNMYHVYFSEETIKKIAERFLAEHKQNMTDINHSMEVSEENTLLESWIVEDPANDKANILGFNYIIF